ncbi:MAG: hypothetical protein WCE48_04870 [Steroidobacteraceae bacterium]
MTSVRSCELPEVALLRKYQVGRSYADCYVTEVGGSVSQSAFVEAFYTTPLFKVERAILKWLAARPSSDPEARQLAEGTTNSFAAWRVEGRNADQLLLADFTGRTKSWLMVAPVGGPGAGSQTRLYFGSAVVPRTERGSGLRRMGFSFHALLGFHRLYSRLLLGAARSRVLTNRRAGAS